MEKRRNVDIEAYARSSQTAPCFICEMLAGKRPHHIIYQDDTGVAFLNRFPTLRGYALVAPIEHREQATGDFSKAVYRALQDLVYAVSEGVRQVVPTERVYILSLGSNQGNSHVHWHVAPLPPGVPYDEQQFQALKMENGVLEIPDEEMAQLAQDIRGHMA